MDNELIADLESAVAKYQEEPQEAAVMALTGVLSFLERHDVPGELRQPLFAIWVAFQDLKNGSTNVLMEASPRNNRAQDSIVTKMGRAQAAAAMELFMKAGMGRQEAARDVAIRVKSWPWGRSKAVSAKQVERWRDAARAGHKETEFDANTFYSIVNSDLVGQFGAKVVADMLLSKPSWINRPQDSK